MQFTVLSVRLRQHHLTLSCPKMKAQVKVKTFFCQKGKFFWIFFTAGYLIQHYFICRPSDFIVSEDAEIYPRTVATLALAVRRSNHSAISSTQLSYLIHKDGKVKM